MSEFKREERYLVFKLRDMSPSMTQFLREWAAARQMPARQYVVVESDWPEYELVWAMIEARATHGIAAFKMDDVDAHAERATIQALVEIIDRELMPHIARLPVQRLDLLNETLIAARELLEGAQ